MRNGRISFSMKKVQDDGGGADSGVAGGQVEATKYVVFRYVTASFFTGDVGNFHRKTLNFSGFCTMWITLTV